jgi:mono/diheme cytochrome c family protein
MQALRFLCVVWLTAGVAAAQTRTGVSELGEAFAAANCAQCHAIGRTGTSPLAAAPALRDLHRRYPVSQLAEALAEGITSGHSTMPEFQLNQPQIADLLAYLTTLEH